MAHGRFVPAQLEELLALEFVAHHLHTALDLFLADLFHPLESVKGLGTKGESAAVTCRRGLPLPAASRTLRQRSAMALRSSSVSVGRPIMK